MTPETISSHRVCVKSYTCTSIQHRVAVSDISQHTSSVPVQVMIDWSMMIFCLENNNLLSSFMLKEC